jgi:hypothetical protein
MRKTHRPIVTVAVLAPSPWRLVKEDADPGNAFVDPTEAHGGSGSVRLTVERSINGDVAVLQPLRGDAWRGKRVRLSGFVKSRIATGEAGLVAVVNNGSRQSSFYPSQQRLSKQETGWHLVSATFDVPLDAALVSVGLWIRHGSGSAWLDDVTFEEVPHDSSATIQSRRSSPMTQKNLTKIRAAIGTAPKQLTDGDFESPSIRIDTW